MGIGELVYSRETLQAVADLLQGELRRESLAVSRVYRFVSDTAVFVRGKMSEQEQVSTTTCLEQISEGVYSTQRVDDVLPDCFKAVRVARDLEEHRFRFTHKGVPLPTQTQIHCEDLPSGITHFDAEFLEFTQEHPGARVIRSLDVDQRVVVNSDGGIAVQSVPFMRIQFSYGYNPLSISRNIDAVVTSAEDIKRLTGFIAFLADPTPDARIRRAGSFSEAFHELVRLAPLRCGSLEEAGLAPRLLTDVVMLNGVPVHEIFGHHFEEPVRMLNPGDVAAFRPGQELSNANIVMKDDPHQTVAGFRVSGFSHFDAYGRERRGRMHIQNGRVCEFLGGEYVDRQKIKQYLGRREWSEPGCSSQFLDGHFPQVRMSCTVLDGEISRIDLRGKVLMVPQEGHTNPSDKTYAVVARECYVLSDDGEPQRIVPVKVTGGIHQALENMVVLDHDTFNAGMCGKPEPIYHPSSRGESSVSVSQVAKAQLWQGQQAYAIPMAEHHLAELIQK